MNIWRRYYFGILAITALATAFIAYCAVREEPNIYKKIHSFSCAVGKYSGDLLLVWTDDFPGAAVPMNEGSNSISVTLGPLPNIKPSSALPDVAVDSFLRVYIDGLTVPIKRVVVSDLLRGPERTRDATTAELRAIIDGLRRNLIPCMKKSYSYVELNDELL